MKPLADLYRPTKIEEVVGQKHLIAENKPLYKIIKSGKIPNMIFYGPSGTGKTTLARIIANTCNKKFYTLNATTAGTKDIKEILSSLGELDSLDGVLLYLDEIQYFSKRQQQSLLECIEDGSVTLIASTTENPYFYIYNAVLSRSLVFEFSPVPAYEIEKHLTRTLEQYAKQNNVKFDIEKNVLFTLGLRSGGDVRKAMNFLDALLLSSSFIDKTYKLEMSSIDAIASFQGSRYDKDGDEHYNILSAFQKSIRGSDPDASVFYLAKLLSSGDLLSLIRRLLVIACEDIGLAYPSAISIVKSCCDSALQLGLPEARIPLSEATIFLATCPKSNSAVEAIDKAMNDVQKGKGKNIPAYLKDSHYQGSSALGNGLNYKYPHAYKNHYVEQKYLPSDLNTVNYYNYQNNKVELLAKKYWDEIKKMTK